MISTLYCIVLNFIYLCVIKVSEALKNAKTLKITLKILKQKVMKKQTTNQFLQMSKEQTQKLTNVVTETLALGLSKSKLFSSGDLWNIQRRSRTMMNRRNFA